MEQLQQWVYVLSKFHERCRTPNAPKLRGGGPEGALTKHGGARRRRGLCMVGEKVAAEAQPVTEPGGVTAALPKLTARPAVTCSAWLGVASVGANVIGIVK